MLDPFYGRHWMLATPFDQNEEVDYDSIPNLVNKAISSGCTGVVGLGVMGEAARLTDRERIIHCGVFCRAAVTAVSLFTGANYALNYRYQFLFLVDSLFYFHKLFYITGKIVGVNFYLFCNLILAIYL